MPSSRTAKKLISTLLLLLSIISCLCVPPANLPVIAPVPCQNPITKESGVCMFFWSCSHVANGIHITSCLDRFLIGSCCKLPKDTETRTKWPFREESSASFLTSTTKSMLQKEGEIKSSAFPEITSHFFHELENKKTGIREEVVTPEIKSITTIKEHFGAPVSHDHMNAESNDNVFSESSLSFIHFFPVAIQSLPSMRKPVKLENSNLRIPVSVEKLQDNREPVFVEPSHDLRKPVMIEPSHDMRNPISLAQYHEIKPQLNKNISQDDGDSHSNKVTEIILSHGTKSPDWSGVEGTGGGITTVRNSPSINRPHDESLGLLDDEFSNVSTENSEHMQEKSTHSPNLDKYSPVYDLMHTGVNHSELNLPTTASYVLDHLNRVSSSSPGESKADCGVSPRYPSARIVGGQKTEYLKWPWMISLRHFERNSYKHKCGAVLLNSIWAATVAHCVYRKLPSEVILHVGDYNLHSIEELHDHKEMRVYLIVMHPDFNPHTFENDLALLRFYQPVPNQVNIAPICLPDRKINLNGKMTVVTGWGRVSEDGELPGYLQEAHIPVVSNNDCREMYIEAGYPGNIPESFICAGHDEGGLDSCEGDSGGPMVMKGDHGKWILIGLISWGMECGSPRLPGVYIRVSNFVEWIQKFIVI